METNKRILIVVPEESVRFILSYGLQHTYKDYEVIAIEEESRALVEAGRTHFDLVIFDVNILNREAVEFTQQLQESLQGVKIIWITSVESLAYKLQAQKMGIYHSLLKPFKLSEVRCIVQRAMNKDFSS